MKTKMIVLPLIAVLLVAAGYFWGLSVNQEPEPVNIAWIKPDQSPIIYAPIDSVTAVIFGLEEGGNVKWQIVKVGNED